VQLRRTALEQPAVATFVCLFVSHHHRHCRCCIKKCITLPKRDTAANAETRGVSGLWAGLTSVKAGLGPLAPSGTSISCPRLLRWLVPVVVCAGALPQSLPDDGAVSDCITACSRSGRTSARWFPLTISDWHLGRTALANSALADAAWQDPGVQTLRGRNAFQLNSTRFCHANVAAAPRCVLSVGAVGRYGVWSVTGWEGVCCHDQQGLRGNVS
jgi:hypothetical protein